MWIEKRLAKVQDALLLQGICTFFRKLFGHFMSQYPRPAYHFTVQWGGSRMSVAEVSGLSADIAVIEHREGGDPEATVRKIPGLHKFANVTLKRGNRGGRQRLLSVVQHGANECR